MSSMELYLDVVVCVFWVLTYTLTLWGTIRYRYPLISPVMPMVVAPLEVACLLLTFKVEPFGYASIAYLCWVILEFSIIITLIRNGYVHKEWRFLYLESLLVLTVIMIVHVTIKEQMLFFTYANTFVGMVFWLIHLIRKEDYPLTWLIMAIFACKFIADAAGFFVYYARGHWIIFVISLGLPFVDLVFILVFIVRRFRRQRA